MPSKSFVFIDLLRRLTKPVFDIRTLFRSIPRYASFLRDLRTFQKMSPNSGIRLADLYPCLYDKSSTTGFDVHYTYLNAWAMRRICSRNPAEHIDIGSQITFVTLLSSIIQTEFVDIRPATISLDKLSSRHGSILALPYSDQSVESVSSLHVIEHIGLGRYGDQINPQGSKQAVAELCRILRPGGHVYLGAPVGIERICFNAHRVLSSMKLVDWFKEYGLSLKEFSYVDDEGKFYVDTQPQSCANEYFGCGMFVFTRE